MEEVPRRTLLVSLAFPLFSTSFNKGGNRRGGWGSFPLCGGTFARSYSVFSEFPPSEPLLSECPPQQGARPRGRTATQRFEKDSEKVLDRVLGKGSQKGSEKGACYGFYTYKGSEKGSQKGF